MWIGTVNEKVRNLGYTILLVGLSFMTTPLFAQEAVNRDEIRQIVREYLIENPEILLEVQQALEQKQQAELALTQQKTIEENREVLYSSPYQVEFGDKNAEKTIVEFFDYNCGFCQRAMADMHQMLETDRNVRFVLKEFPVLGEASLEASRVSLAVSKVIPEKYPQFHVELLGMDGLKNGDRALKLAVSMGADRDRIVEEMENPEIFQAIQEVYEIANGLGITGTPSYVIGDEVVFGAVGYSHLKQVLE
ncbi:MAG: DsbA family protein [Rhizobiaceae bacterium]